MGMIVKRILPQLGPGNARSVRAIIPIMGNQLKHLRTQRGFTIEEAASQMGMSYGGYLKLERGERRLKQDQIVRAAEVYDVPGSAIIAQNLSVPLMGTVSSNGEIKPASNTNGELQLVSAPDDANSTTVAYSIGRGHRLPGIAEEDWLIYHDEMVTEISDDWIGKVCVCLLDDGAKVVCRVHYGKSNGTYDLVGFNSGQMRNSIVSAAAIVTWTRQR